MDIRGYPSNPLEFFFSSYFNIHINRYYIHADKNKKGMDFQQQGKWQSYYRAFFVHCCLYYYKNKRWGKKNTTLLKLIYLLNN